jgi:cytochrome c-type biogenesis protein CcmH
MPSTVPSFLTRGCLMHRSRLLIVTLCCLALPLQAQSRAAGASGEVPAAARNVINSVMSPYCPGLLLSNCPSPSADSLRRAIVSRAARGESEAQLRAALVASYGEMVLASPVMRGAGAVAWVVPFVLILGVGAAIMAWLRRQRRAVAVGDSGPTSVHAALQPGDEERLRRLAEIVRRPG